MKFLLDSNMALWFMEASPRMTDEACNLVKAPESEVFVSTITIWELGIKAAIGKLQTAVPIETIYTLTGFECLEFKTEHAVAAAKLYPHHRDPFDRALIAQAMVEDLVLLTSDRRLELYSCLLYTSRRG